MVSENESDLRRAIIFFQEQGDLSHSASIKAMALPKEGDDIFLTAARVLQMDVLVVMDAWEVCSALHTLLEMELLDGGDGSETAATDIIEVLADEDSVQALNVAEERAFKADQSP